MITKLGWLRICRLNQQYSHLALRRRTMSSSCNEPKKMLVLCTDDNPAMGTLMQELHEKERLNLVIADDLTKLKTRDVNGTESVLIVPPVNVNVLDDMWDHLPNQDIKWIHCFFAGVDSMKSFTEKRLLAREDITVTNGRGAFSYSLAEYIIHASLHFNKKVTRCQENKRNKNWDKFFMPVLKGKTMGFIGYGSIAQSAAKLAKAFDMKIGALKRDPSKSVEVTPDVIFPDKKTAFANSDFVVCTLPGTPSTKHFCSTEEFQAMKPGSVFISCGRGIAVDENALVKVLNERKIYAALDVFETEPLPKDSPVWTVPDDHLLITCHNADYTDDYFHQGIRVFRDNLRAYQQNKPFPTVVDKTLGY